MVHIGDAPHAMANCQPTPGRWRRQKGCAYSAACAECDASADTAEAALRRQFAEAGGAPALCAERARIIVHFSGDMKGLLQLLGHSGANATFPCLKCMARINQTMQSGVPHLRELPEPFKSADARAPEIMNPPLREGTEQIAAHAAASRWCCRPLARTRSQRPATAASRRGPLL